MLHVIRLRGPWEWRPLVRWAGGGDGSRDASRELPVGGKTQVPSDWEELLGGDFIGRVRYTRRFNRPTNLEPADRVWLVLEGVDHEAEIVLNDRPLGLLRGRSSRQRTDITALVAPHNLLAVVVAMPPAVFGDPAVRGDRAGRAGGLIGEVRLEIES